MASLAVLACTVSGCGSSPPPAVASSPTAITDHRLKYKEEYRQVLSKDGKIVVKPGMIKKFQQQQGAASGSLNPRH